MSRGGCGMVWIANKHNWVTDENQNVICTVVDKRHMPIIAAAPDLLEALKKSCGECRESLMLDGVTTETETKMTCCYIGETVERAGGWV